MIAKPNSRFGSRNSPCLCADIGPYANGEALDLHRCISSTTHLTEWASFHREDIKFTAAVPLIIRSLQVVGKQQFEGVFMDGLADMHQRVCIAHGAQHAGNDGQGA